MVHLMAAGVVALIAAAPVAAAPIRLSGLAASYCVDVDAIPITVENLSSRTVWLSLEVEKRASGGSWFHYWGDVFGSEPYPMQVRIYSVEGRTSKAFRWRVRLLGAGSLLSPGTYRFVAHVAPDLGAAPTHHVEATFSAGRESCTPPANASP